MEEKHFFKFRSVPEFQAWESFVLIVDNFRRNHKALNYKEIVKNMLINFQTVDTNLSIKSDYFRNNLDTF